MNNATAQTQPVWQNTAQCRSCGAPIYWLRNLTTQKVAPIDALCNEAGNVVVNVERGTYIVLGTSEAREQEAGRLHTNHFQVCPQRNQWHKHGSVRDTKAPQRGGLT